MLSKRTIIYSVTATIVLLAAIAAGCLCYISHQKEQNEAYNNCKPYSYIASPQEAHIYIIGDYQELSYNNLLRIAPSEFPLKKIWQDCSHEERRPLYIACYPDNQVAAWCAIRPEEREIIISYIADSLCNGYAPIEEKSAYGTLLHFSTFDNRFLHIFYDNSVIGCSYSEKRISQKSSDTDVCSFIESCQNNWQNAIVYYDNGYKYCNIHISSGRCELLFTTAQCHFAPFARAAMLDTTSISSSTKAFIQIQTQTNEHLTPTATLAYIPSAEKPDSLVGIYTAHISDLSKLYQELYTIYTPYGYHADSTTIAKWMPKAFISHSDYWITTDNDILYATHSYKELKQYIDDIRRHKRISCTDATSASVHIVSIDIAPNLLPNDISCLLPSIANRAGSICINKTNDEYEWVIEFDTTL